MLYAHVKVGLAFQQSTLADSPHFVQVREGRLGSRLGSWGHAQQCFSKVSATCFTYFKKNPRILLESVVRDIPMGTSCDLSSICAP